MKHREMLHKDETWTLKYYNLQIIYIIFINRVSI
jgi:hypothetical protein